MHWSYQMTPTNKSKTLSSELEEGVIVLTNFSYLIVCIEYLVILTNYLYVKNYNFSFLLHKGLHAFTYCQKIVINMQFLSHKEFD